MVAIYTTLEVLGKFNLKISLIFQSEASQKDKYIDGLVQSGCNSSLNKL